MLWDYCTAGNSKELPITVLKDLDLICVVSCNPRDPLTFMTKIPSGSLHRLKYYGKPPGQSTDQRKPSNKSDTKYGLIV